MKKLAIKTPSMKQAFVLCTALVLTTAITSSAFARGGESSGGKRKGPPQEAFTACQSKSEGDSCQFQGRKDDTLSGTCGKPKHGKEGLICKPEGHKKHKGHGGKRPDKHEEGDNNQ